MPTPSIIDLGQVSQPVTDLEKSVAFYRDVVGLRFLFSAPPGLAFFMIGGVRLMLSTPEGVETGPSTSVLYFRVPQIDEAWAKILGKADLHDGPHLVAKLPDHELWMAFFKDPDGNLLAFMEERR